VNRVINFNSESVFGVSSKGRESFSQSPRVLLDTFHKITYRPKPKKFVCVLLCVFVCVCVALRCVCVVLVTL